MPLTSVDNATNYAHTGRCCVSTWGFIESFVSATVLLLLTLFNKGGGENLIAV